MSITSLASAANTIHRLLSIHGIDPDPVFRAEGLDPALRRVSRARYDRGRLDAVWRRAAVLIGDPCFGLRAPEGWQPAHLHALGFAWLASRTLREAVGRLVRYGKVLHDQMQVVVSDDVDGFAVRTMANPDPAIPSRDAFWASFVAMCRQSRGGVLDPVGLELRRPEPSCSAAFFGFFRCPVRFGAKEDRLVLPAELVDAELPTANAELAAIHDAVLAEYLGQLDRDRFAPRVKAALIARLPSGSATPDEIAEALHVSQRTLQRRLADEGTSFKALLDEVRRELAERYLADGATSLGEISFLLGFAEAGSFSRAFRRWTGRAPSEYRAG